MIQNSFSLRITFLLAALIIFNFYSFSQTKKLAEITAEGYSSLRIKPDIVTFSIAIEKMDSVEKNVIKSLNEEVQSLTQSLERIGFQNKSITIADYRISNNYDTDTKQKTYTATNILKLEFKLDNKIIDMLYNEIQANNFKDLDLRYETGISDSLEKATRVSLVQLAIENAKANAINISKNLGLVIIKVKSVYKENPRFPIMANQIIDVQLAASKMVKDADISYKTSFDKFEVEDIELDEKITVVYEVSN